MANLLNLSDGLFGDAMNMQILCTFNTPLTEVDPALLRKGRLTVKHEFKELSVKDANALFKYLGKEHITDKPMSLSDIYGLETENFHKPEIQEVKRMGFGAC